MTRRRLSPSVRIAAALKQDGEDHRLDVAERLLRAPEVVDADASPPHDQNLHLRPISGHALSIEVARSIKIEVGLVRNQDPNVSHAARRLRRRRG